MKKPSIKTVKKISAGLAVVFALGANEMTGYRIFDAGKGENILCALDPSCRRMTKGEVELARGIFGDKIAYDNIKIYRRKYMGVLGSSGCTLSPNGNIYMGDERGETYARDFSRTPHDQKHLAHELTHIWQSQIGINLQQDAITAFWNNGFTYSQSYNYDVNDTTPFARLNIEQQAHLVEDYYVTRQQVRFMVAAKATSLEMRPLCKTLASQERKLTLKGWRKPHDLVLEVKREESCLAVQPPRLHAPLKGSSPAKPMDFCG